MDIDNKNIIKQSAEIGVSAIGSLVGFAIGGPIGAVVGGVATPAVNLTYQIINNWQIRQHRRITDIVTYAFRKTGKSEEQMFNDIKNDDGTADSLIKMIRQLIDTEPDLDYLFAEIMASFLTTSEQAERNRMMILYQSIRTLNNVQVQILRKMYTSNGILSAKDISNEVLIPEVELRNAVRDLELKGMIIDNGKEPTIWELRELGYAIAEILNKMKGEFDNEIF